MKRCLIILACVAATLALTGIVSAQTNPAGKSLQGKSQVPVKKRVLGTVMSVDTVAKAIVVKSKEAAMTFEVNGTTRIKVDSRYCALAKVPTEARVTIIYMRHGDRKLALWVIAETTDQSNIGKQMIRPGRT